MFYGVNNNLNYRLNKFDLKKVIKYQYQGTYLILKGY